MWRSLLAVILLPSLTAAQTPATPPAPVVASTPQTNAHPLKPKYQAYTFYDGVRRGTQEDIAIRLTLSGLVTTLKSPVTGVVPLRLELQPAEGLTFTAVRYPETYARKLSGQADPVQVASWPMIQFKVRADRNATPGPRLLAGKLTFQPIHFDSTVGSVEQMDIGIPITVVEHNAKVQKERWPIAHTPVALIVVMIMLLPVLIPLIVPIYLICAAEGNPGCG